MNNLINIKVENDQLLVSSLEVAENFGKRHTHILGTIKNMTAENSALQSLFYESTYTSKQNKQLPMYLMNRDGFSLLAMGFTGKEAIEWKLKYINAFNEMEQKLKNQVQPRLPKTYKEALLELVAQVEAREKLEAENAELKPKASYYDTVLNCKDLIPISKIAKDYGWSAQKLNKYLHEKRIQYKQSDTWLLYKDYAKNGFVSSKTPKTTDRNGVEHAHIHTCWTQKGRLFIYDLLKNDGIVPLIERGEE